MRALLEPGAAPGRYLLRVATWDSDAKTTNALDDFASRTTRSSPWRSSVLEETVEWSGRTRIT